MTSQLELSIPKYDQNKYAAKYHELQTEHKVSIPSDISALGFQGINALFSDIQGKMDRVHELLVEATQMMTLAKTVSDATKSSYDSKRDTLLASKMQEEYQSFKQLEAQVNSELADDRKAMQRAKMTAALFIGYHRVVASTYKNLESAKKTLELQSNIWKKQLPPGTGQGMYSPNSQ